MTEMHIEDSQDPDREDGDQTPTAIDLPDEEGDAGISDDGTEEWYEEDEG